MSPDQIPSPSEQSGRRDESGVFWRQDVGEGGSLYLLRKEGGGIYVEIRQGHAALDITIEDISGDSLMSWLDRSSS